MNSIFKIFISILISTCFVSAQLELTPISAAYDDYVKFKESSQFGLEWMSLGPTINSARVESVQLHPDRPGTMFVAFGSGNLWRTTDHGLTWKVLFEDQPVQGIGDIAIAPSNPDIIYVGTGESLKKPRNFTMPGNGVYKSTDAGETWMHLGLEDSWHIGEVVVHPSNPDIVMVAVLGHFWTPNSTRGIFRTEDGGKNWQKVLFLDEMTGANDVVFSPSNPEIVYASMWENYPGINGKNSGIYKSADGGKNWKAINEGLPQKDSIGRIGLAVSYQNPDKVYAFMDYRGKEPAGQIFISENGGINWAITHKEKLPVLSRIGWYFVDIYVNPLDDEEIFGLGVRIVHSKNGGKDFNYLAGDVYHLFPSGADRLHLDHCEMWINPNNPEHIVIGNDGGLYVSYNKGESWMHYNNLPTGEYYDIAVDNQDPYMIYGGTQDDGTVFGPAKEWSPKFADTWKYLWVDAWSGGDGCITQIDPKDPNTVYFSAQEGAIRRRNMSTGKSISIRPKFQKGDERELEYNFINPYFISPHDSKTIYHAGNYVFKSTNRGDHWECISSDMSLSVIEGKEALSSGAMAESPVSKGRLYFGTDNGGFWFTDNDGLDWEERSLGLPNAYIRSITPSQFNDSTVYLTLSGINYDDFKNHIYFTDNNGKTWIDISSNLPEEVAYVIKEDPTKEGVLYAGLYRGVYISIDNGKNWSLLGKGLPNCAVADLEIEPKSKDMIAATHGRGIYKINLKPIHDLVSGIINKEKDHLFEFPIVKAPWINDTHKDPDYNTAEKLPIKFWSTQDQKVMIKIQKDNDVLWEKELNASLGLNEYRWDMIIRKTDSMSPYHIHYDVFIKAGKYQLSLETETGILEKDLEIKKGIKPEY